MKKYGNPHRASRYYRHYKWRGSSFGEEIILDCFRDSEKMKNTTEPVFDAGKAYRP